MLGVQNLPHMLLAEFFRSDGWDVGKLRQWVLEPIVQQISCIQLFPELEDVMVSFFDWRLLRGFLPLDDRLRKWGMALPSKCVCCSKEAESLNHLFLDGPAASQFLSSSLGGTSHIRSWLPVVICWSLWKVRNQVLFQEELLSVQRFGYVTIPPKVSTSSISVSWLKPLLGFVKLNSDASVVEEVASGRGLLRDHDGNLIFAFYKEFGAAEVLLAEDLALLHGLRLCKEKGYIALQVEVDLESGFFSQGGYPG
ncbi:uncharacterized protein LOC113773861 [Coffea eugenioides]|uniref:uncharacterized protein LOC113773861 n=1 Tax=Coffea eugenioides TaxID=49369 RepID=UPI000F615A2C|nr:uncharacterized protein LOC113773861 [Coffea eugenioides]